MARNIFNSVELSGSLHCLSTGRSTTAISTVLSSAGHTKPPHLGPGTRQEERSGLPGLPTMNKHSLFILVASLSLIGLSIKIIFHSILLKLPFVACFPFESQDEDEDVFDDGLMDKRGGKWNGMRMFKRGGDALTEEEFENYENEMEKRDPWKMRMFKR